MRVSLFLAGALIAAATASWVCPVFFARYVDLDDTGGLPATATLNCIEVMITPVPVTDETMRDYADWDYMVSERLSMTPCDGAESILLCFDLGVVPEGTRVLYSVMVDGLEVSPCSTICVPVWGEDGFSDEDTLYIVTQDPWHRYGIYRFEDMRARRSTYDDVDDFHSAVPETACFYSIIYEIPSDEEPFDVEVVYLARGWTYLCGAEALSYSLLQPGLWKGPVEEASFLIDLSSIEDRESWTVDFMGEESSGEQMLRLHLEEFEINGVTEFPVISITPPDLPAF
jgi:hypothetical protein